MGSRSGLSGRKAGRSGLKVDGLCGGGGGGGGGVVGEGEGE